MFCWVCNLTHSKIEVLQWIIIIEKWTDAEGYTPQYPIFSNATGDQGSRFVDLNGDGRLDFVYHLWTPNEVFKGAYINNPELGNFISNVTFAPPIPIAANNGSDLGTSSCFCHIHIILNVCAPVSPPLDWWHHNTAGSICYWWPFYLLYVTKQYFMNTWLVDKCAMIQSTRRNRIYSYHCTSKHSFFYIWRQNDHWHEVRPPFCFVTLLSKIPSLTLWRHVHGFAI